MHSGTTVLYAADVTETLNLGTEQPPLIRNMRFSEDRTEYLENVRKIQQYIFNGDSYQVNHTLRLHFDLEGSAEALYRALRQRQRVAYSAWLKLPDNTFYPCRQSCLLKNAEGN